MLYQKGDSTNIRPRPFVINMIQPFTKSFGISSVILPVLSLYTFNQVPTFLSPSPLISFVVKNKTEEIKTSKRRNSVKLTQMFFIESLSLVSNQKWIKGKIKTPVTTHTSLNFNKTSVNSLMDLSPTVIFVRTRTHGIHISPSFLS